MATEIIAVGTGPAASTDITVTAGEPVTLCLKTATGRIADRASAAVEMKDDDAVYTVIGYLTDRDPAKALTAPGTYRVSRTANGEAIGVFRS